MLSASASIETPAFTRRTLAWLRTSLLNGMSRDGFRTIFWVAAIGNLRDGPAGSLSPSPSARRKNPLRPLALARTGPHAPGSSAAVSGRLTTSAPAAR